MNSITIQNLADLRTAPAPLYHVFAMERDSQPAYVELDIETGAVSTNYDSSLGGMPAPVWQGIIRRYRVPSAVSGAALADALENDKIRALLQRVQDGAAIVWDGGNWIGQLTDDAAAAEQELGNIFQTLETANIIDVDDYCSGVALTELWSDQSLDVAAAEIEGTAESDDIVLDGDVEDYLVERAGAYWYDGEFEALTPVIVRELIARGWIHGIDDEHRAYCAQRGIAL